MVNLIRLIAGSQQAKIGTKVVIFHKTPRYFYKTYIFALRIYKHIMRKIRCSYTSIIVLACLLALSGCRNKHKNKDDIKPQPVKILEIDPEGIRCSASGDTCQIEIMSSDDWEIKNDVSWVDVKKTSRSTASVIIDINHDDEREGRVEFISGELSTELVIEQEASPIIELAEKSITTDGDGGTFEVLYMSNTDTEIITNEDWIRLIPNSTHNNIAFEVLRNLGDARKGTINVQATYDNRFHRILNICQGPKIPHPKLTIKEGSSMTITSGDVTVLHPEFEDMENRDLIWSSSDPEVAEVNQSGEVSVHKSGHCVIKVQNEHHNVEASISIEVRLKAEGFHIMFGNQDITENPISVRFVGEKLPVTVTVVPNGAYSDDIVIFSSNPETAYFQGQTLNCISPGKTEIYVESAFSGIRRNFTVMVIEYE